MQIAIVGNDDFVTGFQLAGVSAVFPTTDQNIDEKVEQAINTEGIGVIVMDSEEVSKLSNKTKKALDRLITPVLVTLSAKGKEEDLRELIRRTVGVDLWK